MCLCLWSNEVYRFARNKYHQRLTKTRQFNRLGQYSQMWPATSLYRCVHHMFILFKLWTNTSGVHTNILHTSFIHNWRGDQNQIFQVLLHYRCRRLYRRATYLVKLVTYSNNSEITTVLPNTKTWCEGCACASAYNTITNYLFDNPRRPIYYRLPTLLKVKYDSRFFRKGLANITYNISETLAPVYSTSY